MQEGRGFFCSELVIKAFKVCGILSNEQMDEASSNWLPGDLASDKNKLKLIEGASLGPEQLVFSGGMWEKEEPGAVSKFFGGVGDKIGLGKKKSGEF